MVDFLPVARNLATPTENAQYFPYNYPRLAAMNVLAHAFAGRMEALDAWSEKLTDEQRALILEWGIAPDIWRMAVQLIGEPSPANLERRLDVTSRVLQSADRQDWLTTVGTRIVHQGRAQLDAGDGALRGGQAARGALHRRRQQSLRTEGGR